MALSSYLSATPSEPPKLRKGEACMYCRRRKMKCDGARPICGQCARGDRAEDCEYARNSDYSRTKSLEDAIARMEARIKELETPNAGLSPNLVLYSPYSSPGPHQLPNDDDLNAQPPHVVATPSEPWWTSEEPTQSMRQPLINSFLHFSGEIDFFLNTSRFRQSALRRLPLGHHDRPLPALLMASYLWGVHLSKDPLHTIHEETILARALDLLAGSLSSDHPQRIMHTIQAEVLLANYLFSSGRLLEAKYHLSTVVGLCFAARLNKIRSSEAVEPSPLAPPVDSVEEGERIRAWWTVTSMDKCWSCAFDSPPPSQCPAEAPGEQCDTWPFEMEEYERGGLSTSSYTAQKFLSEVSDDGSSALTYLAKAAILWEWSNSIVHQLKSGLSEQAMMLHTNSFTQLDHLLDQVTAALGQRSQKDMMLPRCIASAATIRLHSGLSGHSLISRNKCLASAEAIVLALNSLLTIDSIYVNPIIASIWTAASQVIMKEVNLWRSAVNVIGQKDVDRAEGDLRRIFNAGMNVMTVLAERSQLIRKCLGLPSILCGCSTCRPRRPTVS